MTKAPSNLQELRRRIYRKAKSETTHRFWGLFVHITKVETLEEAYRIAKGNGGAPGIDGQSFRDVPTQVGITMMPPNGLYSPPPASQRTKNSLFFSLDSKCRHAVPCEP